MKPSFTEEELGRSRCLAAALTLLAKKNVLTVEESTQAMQQGYDVLYDLLDEKYRLIMEGRL